MLENKINPSADYKEVIGGAAIEASPNTDSLVRVGRPEVWRALATEGSRTGIEQANSLHLIGPSIRQETPELSLSGRSAISIHDVAEQAGQAAEKATRGSEVFSNLSAAKQDLLISSAIEAAKLSAVGVAGELESRSKDKIVEPQARTQGIKQPLDPNAIGMPEAIPLEGQRMPIPQALQEGLRLGQEQLLADQQLGAQLIPTAGVLSTIQALGQKVAEEIGLIEPSRQAVPQAMALTQPQAVQEQRVEPEVVNLREMIERSLERKVAA